MQINRQLNLVQTCETASGTIHVHSEPLSREVWKSYFLVLSKTYSQLFSQGIHLIAGPSTVMNMLEHIARRDGVWVGPEGVEQGLLGEIRRLTNVVMANGAGWRTIPYEIARTQASLDQDAMEEIEGAIVFFICASGVLKGPKAREKLTVLLGMMEFQWQALNTSSNVTEYAASLPTSTRVEPTTATAPVSSLPR